VPTPLSDARSSAIANMYQTECGPLVPNTPILTDRTKSLADLNPCPLKACCSNWGFCGVFPGHCALHAPEGGGPGTKEKGFQNTCVSNCENEIKSKSVYVTKKDLKVFTLTSSSLGSARQIRTYRLLRVLEHELRLSLAQGRKRQHGQLHAHTLGLRRNRLYILQGYYQRRA
jgi:hypothetical protein